jgi:hypothetical protein
LLTSPSVSGLSAAHTVYLNGGNVVVLDKQGMSIFLVGSFGATLLGNESINPPPLSFTPP